MHNHQLHSRIYIITVIYNRQIDEIRSLPEFMILMDRHPGVGLIVADNSTDIDVLDQNRKTAAESGRLHYLECGGNVGLSRAYNKALEVISQDETYWVMLSDDDTKFSLEYLENGCRQIERQALRIGTSATSKKDDSSIGSQTTDRQDKDSQSSNRRNADSQKDDRNSGREPLRMLCGVVLAGRGWISPRSEHAKELAFSQMLRKPKPGIYRDLYPINSGLFLEGSAIREVGGFDERLFLDQVDFLMMDRLRARGIRRIGVLPGEIRQAFSGEVGAGTGTVQSSDERWKIFRKDFETYCDLTNKPWYYRAYILGRRRLMLEVQKKL